MVIPLLKQHFLLLQRNLIYTGMTRARAKVYHHGETERGTSGAGITRARAKVYLVGSLDAYAMAVKNNEQEVRRTHLPTRLRKTMLLKDS